MIFNHKFYKDEPKSWFCPEHSQEHLVKTENGLGFCKKCLIWGLKLPQLRAGFYKPIGNTTRQSRYARRRERTSE